MILRSEPNHMSKPSSTSAIGLLSGSSRPAFRGIKNRNAAFPVPNNFVSLTNDLVRDSQMLVLFCGGLDGATHIYAIGP